MRLLPIVSVLLWACGGPSDGRPWAGSVDTLPSGTIVVSNPVTGLWDSTSAWRLVEDLRIGRVDGGGPAMFGLVNDLAVDAFDRVYVLDRQAQEVRVFDREGAHVRTIGREGGGPGEFRGAHGVAIDRQERLWVADSRLGRFSVFDTSGLFVTSHRRAPGCYGYIWTGRALTDGSILDYMCVLGDAGQDIRHAFAVWDSLAGYTDTSFIPPAETDPPLYDFRDDRGFGTIMAVPFAPGRVTHADGRAHLWVGSGDRYRVFEIAPPGDTLRVIERVATPTPVTVAERDSALEPVREQAGAHPVNPALVPDVKPFFSQFVRDDDGYLWVRRPLPHGEHGTAFDVFDPEGRFLGSVRAPFALNAYIAPVIRRDQFYGVAEDELDVAYVVRARIDGRDR